MASKKHNKRKSRNDIIPVKGDSPESAQHDQLKPKPAHGDPHTHGKISREGWSKRESGEPGGGAGRRDVVGRTGIYPISGDERPSGQAELRPLGDWAGGDRGIAGYEDSGGSELVMREGQLIGGLTSDASGRPTINIHGKTPETPQEDDAARKETKKSPPEKPSSENRNAPDK